MPESFLSGKHCGPSGTPEILARCGCPLTLQAAVVCNSCLPSLLAPAFADARGSSYISEGWQDNEVFLSLPGCSPCCLNLSGAAGVRPPCGF